MSEISESEIEVDKSMNKLRQESLNSIRKFHRKTDRVIKNILPNHLHEPKEFEQSDWELRFCDYMEDENCWFELIDPDGNKRLKSVFEVTINEH